MSRQPGSRGLANVTKFTDEPASMTQSALPKTGHRAWLYRVDGEDAPVRVDRLHLPDLGDQQILWLDVDLDTTQDLDTLWRDLMIREQIDTLDTTDPRPQLIRHESFVQLNVLAVRASDSDFVPVVLYCLVGKNWIATLHHGELDLVDRFNEPLAGDTRLGELDGPAFLSMVLDWQLNGYFRAIERLQADVDQLDEELLQPWPNQPALVDRLYKMRRRVTKLRTTLSPHRDVFGLLSHPKSEALLGSSATPEYQRLLERLESALDAVNTAREMIVGSFDIFMTQISQATNDIMKRLTLVSVLLLPAVVIAGIMGMNFKVGLFEVPWLFWVTVLSMALLAGSTLVLARRRKWI
jgi:magnesium transporter